MGLRATVYAISPASFAAAASGKLDEIQTGDEKVYLDKAWYEISLMVTCDPAASFLQTGHTVMEDDALVEAHAPQAAADLAALFRETPQETLFDNLHRTLAQFDHPAPASNDRANADKYLQPYLQDFIDFVAAAAANGNGLFVVIA